MENVTHQVDGSASTLRVIGAGFGRTGTLSLRQALEHLGFGPCGHMHTNFEHPERFAHWEEALRRKEAGELIDWRPLLEGYPAIVDWPAASFWRELAAAHPAAKVILTVRDPARWFDSMQDTIFPFLASLEVTGGPGLPGAVIVDATFDRRTDDRAHCEGVSTRHIETVRGTIPEDRLLVFDVREGWEPLCAFLGVQIPDTPFPRTNTIVEFNADVEERRA